MRKKDWKRVGKDALITCAVMCSAVLITALLSRVNDDNNPFAASMFILAVAVVARLTDGYIFGVLSSVAAVLLVNTVFTEPFGRFSLTMPSYPLTFAAMLLVSLLVSALTSQIKSQQKLQIEAEREKMRANLLRAIAHDIRTPLTSIMGASSTLLENKELGAVERDGLLAEIGKDAQWLVRVTENLLAVTKFSSKGARLNTEEEVVDEIVSASIVKFHKNNPQMPVHTILPDEIVLVPMDAVLIEQVLLNLMENVVFHGKYATQIGLSVRIGPQNAFFSVEDDGCGIDSAILPKVFDGYVHADDSGREGERRNMGIGLSVCRTIILAHGGNIQAYNRADGGAGFCFSLPLGKEEEE